MCSWGRGEEVGEGKGGVETRAPGAGEEGKGERDKEKLEERNPPSRWDFVGGFRLDPLLSQLVDPQGQSS